MTLPEPYIDAYEVSHVGLTVTAVRLRKSDDGRFIIGKEHGADAAYILTPAELRSLRSTAKKINRAHAQIHEADALWRSVLRAADGRRVVIERFDQFVKDVNR